MRTSASPAAAASPPRGLALLLVLLLLAVLPPLLAAVGRAQPAPTLPNAADEHVEAHNAGWLMAEMSDLVYELVHPRDCNPCAPPLPPVCWRFNGKRYTFESWTSVVVSLFDVEFAIWYNAELRVAALVFQGTTSHDIDWWKVNFNYRLCGVEECTIGEGDKLVRGGFMRGFFNGWSSVRPSVLRALKAMPASDASPLHVWIGGHSLGGAYATMAALDLARRPSLMDANIRVEFGSTIGAPRVVNESHVNLDASPPLLRFHRYVNHGLVLPWAVRRVLEFFGARFSGAPDLVTLVPPDYFPFRGVRNRRHWRGITAVFALSTRCPRKLVEFQMCVHSRQNYIEAIGERYGNRVASGPCGVEDL